MQASSSTEITCLDYDLALCAECGKGCLDDLVRIGILPSELVYPQFCMLPADADRLSATNIQVKTKMAMK